ncbi:MAG: LapA family protein [Dehalococcoidales bacterium]
MNAVHVGVLVALMSFTSGAIMSFLFFATRQDKAHRQAVKELKDQLKRLRSQLGTQAVSSKKLKQAYSRLLGRVTTARKALNEAIK